MRAGLRLSLAAALGLGAAAARAYDGSEGLDVFRGPVVSDSRAVGLGGAITPLAEGLISLPHNVAALGHRRRDLKRALDWDYVALIPLLPVFIPLDYDNDGVIDPLNSAFLFQLALSFQYRGNGLGIYWQSQSLQRRLPNGRWIGIDTGRLFLGFGRSFWRDQIVLGAALVRGDAVVWVPNEAVRYGGYGVQLGALWRPQGENYRVGLSVRPGMDLTASSLPATVASDCGPEPERYACVAPVARAHLPLEVAAGAAYRFGPGSGRFNRLSPVAQGEVETSADEGQAPPPDPADAEGPPGPFLVSIELVYAGRTPTAIGYGGLMGQFDRPAGEAAPSGVFDTFSPRLGFEWEPYQRRLRLRAGTYFEPSRFDDRRGRFHFTGGFDFRLFWEIRLSFAADFARDYFNLLAGLGLWWP